MAAKRPYFPFYVNDFETDPVVEAMTAEQVGAYLLLLCKAWRETPCGSVPNDDATLSRWTRLKPKRWAAIKAGVVKAFKSSGGRLIQKRMTEEASRLAARSEAASASASRRWQCERNANASISHEVGICETDARAFGSEYGSGSESSSSRVGGVGEGVPPNGDLTPENLAQQFAFHYAGSANSHRNPFKLAAEFREWIDKLSVKPMAIADEILRAGRDRSEPPWELKKRLVADAKPDALDGLIEFVARGEKSK